MTSPFLKSMNSLFRNCHKLSYINLQNFKFENNVNLREVFYDCANIKILILKDPTTKEKILFNKNFSDNTNINCIIGENEKCKECQITEGSKYKCKTCNAGYILPDNEHPTSCKKCFINNCNKCSTYISCDECIDGFYLSENKGECLNCGIGCLKCNGQGNCSQCNEGYSLNNDTVCSKISNNDNISDIITNIINNNDTNIFDTIVNDTIFNDSNNIVSDTIIVDTISENINNNETTN